MPDPDTQPRLLVVEDNEMNRDMLTRRLARNGFATLVAETGEQGIAAELSLLDDLRDVPVQAQPVLVRDVLRRQDDDGDITPIFAAS